MVYKDLIIKIAVFCCENRLCSAPSNLMSLLWRCSLASRCILIQVSTRVSLVMSWWTDINHCMIVLR